VRQAAGRNSGSSCPRTVLFKRSKAETPTDEIAGSPPRRVDREALDAHTGSCSDWRAAVDRASKAVGCDRADRADAEQQRFRMQANARAAQREP
jgi:hypothetical protein